MRVRKSALAIALLLFAVGCALPAPAVLGGPAQGPFENTAALAEAMRARQLVDRTGSFTSSLSYDGGTQGYAGDGALVVTEPGTDIRVRVALTDGRTGELVAIGADVFGSSSDSADTSTTEKPWRRSTLDESLGGSSPDLFFLVVLTQLDSLDEAFALRGSSAELRGDTPVTEYRMAADYLETLELTRRHLGLATTQYPPQEPIELLLTLAVDSESRLVDARFDGVAGDEQSEFSYTFSGWGEPVDVSPPPPELVAAG